MREFRRFLVRALQGDDENVPVSIRARVKDALIAHGHDARKRSQEWWADFFWRFLIEQNLREIDALINRYNQMADWHHEQAEKARRKMREATDRLHAINEFIEGVDDVFAEKERTGKFDRAKAMKLLKARGVDVKPDEDEQMLENRLKKEKGDALAEKPIWGKQYDDGQADAEHNDSMEREARQKAQELVERRDEIRNGGYGAEEEAGKLKQVTEEYKADIQRKAVELEKLKNKDSEQTNQLRATVQKDLDASQAKQTHSEVSDFEAMAGVLKGEFAASATNAAAAVSQTPPTIRSAPPLAGPGSSA